MTTDKLDVNRWVVGLRGPKNVLDPRRPYAYLSEDEADGAGGMTPTATVFLTNRECPYRCVMCDLWRNTLDETVPPGAIPEQIRWALDSLPAGDGRPRQIKLYNASSFFDPKAIPLGDYPAIAETVSNFDRVIVECHPALVGGPVLEFRDLIRGRLEVAIGLETAHPDVLARLNKRFTLGDFRRAAAFLRSNDIDLRVFLLLRPPFMTESEGVEWGKRSLDVAFDAGASVCCVIPTRGGNGAMEALSSTGDFAPPRLRSLESVLEYGLNLGRGRVFGDIWDIERFYDCDCSPARAERIARMNRDQHVTPAIACGKCG